MEWMTLNSIQSAIPHREPFLLVDEIVEQTDNRIVCRKRFTGDEFTITAETPSGNGEFISDEVDITITGR